jgi:hypothetical protein
MVVGYTFAPCVTAACAASGGHTSRIAAGGEQVFGRDSSNGAIHGSLIERIERSDVAAIVGQIRCIEFDRPSISN